MVSKIWTIPVIFIMTFLFSDLGLADERPRNVTLDVNRTEVRRHANGAIDTVNAPLKIYYGSDGTAYVQLGLKSNGDNVGVVLPPDVNFDSHTSVEPFPSGPAQRVTSTASINGQMSNLNIMLTMNMCDLDGRNCFYATHGFILQVSGTTCRVVGGTHTVKSASTATNPTVSTSIVGSQTCSILPGRQLGG
jgi:hypothetical protein